MLELSDLNAKRLKDLNLLSVREVARRLNYSKRHIYTLIHEQGLPAIRFSKRKILVPEKRLMKWLKKKSSKNKG